MMVKTKNVAHTCNRCSIGFFCSAVQLVVCSRSKLKKGNDNFAKTHRSKSQISGCESEWKVTIWKWFENNLTYEKFDTKRTNRQCEVSKMAAKIWQSGTFKMSRRKKGWMPNPERLKLKWYDWNRLTQAHTFKTLCGEQRKRSKITRMESRRQSESDRTKWTD